MKKLSLVTVLSALVLSSSALANDGVDCEISNKTNGVTHPIRTVTLFSKGENANFKYRSSKVEELSAGVSMFVAQENNGIILSSLTLNIQGHRVSTPLLNLSQNLLVLQYQSSNAKTSTSIVCSKVD